MKKNNFNLPLVIKGCKKGNRSSQLELYQHFYSFGLGICMRYSSKKEEALEILNTGFLNAFTTINEYNSSNSFNAWLKEILIETAIDYHRQHYKSATLRTLSYEENTKVPSHYIAIEQLEYEDLLQVVQRLSPINRVVFNLAVIDGFTHKEICEKLGINEGTSKSSLANARREIQLLLGGVVVFEKSSNK